MTFEDLLKPRAPACKTCDFIASLSKKALRDEIDAAMAKAKFTDVSLARALAEVGEEFSPSPPKDAAVQRHREQRHRTDGKQ